MLSSIVLRCPDPGTFGWPGGGFLGAPWGGYNFSFRNFQSVKLDFE